SGNVVDRELGGDRPADRLDQLFELAGWDQASQLDRYIEQASAHVAMVAPMSTPTWSARDRRNAWESTPSLLASWRSLSRTSHALPTSSKNVWTTPSPDLAHASWSGRAGWPK